MCASAVQDSMATAVSMGRILSVMVIFAAALPPAAGLATPAVLETVAVRGVASGGLRVAEGNADTIDSGICAAAAAAQRVATHRVNQSAVPGRRSNPNLNLIRDQGEA